MINWKENLDKIIPFRSMRFFIPKNLFVINDKLSVINDDYCKAYKSCIKYLRGNFNLKCDLFTESFYCGENSPSATVYMLHVIDDKDAFILRQLIQNFTSEKLIQPAISEIIND